MDHEKATGYESLVVILYLRLRPHKTDEFHLYHDHASSSEYLILVPVIDVDINITDGLCRSL